MIAILIYLCTFLPVCLLGITTSDPHHWQRFCDAGDRGPQDRSEQQQQQPFSQVRSPHPRLSRFCLALAILHAMILWVAYLRPGYLAGAFSECWITAISLVATAMLLVSHFNVRIRYRTFGRAVPVFAGSACVALWVVLHTALSCETISETTGWFLLSQVWFWAGYWIEWWTRFVADILEGFGC